MLEIIGAGYGRIGTLSLKASLERLGFGPCSHAVEFMRHPEHQARWEAAFHGNPQWSEVFAGYRSTVDFPGAAFWRELVDTYPEAKVILTVRDPQEWYVSMCEIFLAAAGPDGQPLIPGAGKGSFIKGGDWSQMMADLRDEHIAIADFKRHIEDVCSYVPSHRLLVYEVRQGWKPLCDFLGVCGPDEPFPHLNDSEACKDLMRNIACTGLLLTHQPKVTKRHKAAPIGNFSLSTMRLAFLHSASGPYSLASREGLFSETELPV